MSEILWQKKPSDSYCLNTSHDDSCTTADSQHCDKTSNYFESVVNVTTGDRYYKQWKLHYDARTRYQYVEIENFDEKKFFRHVVTNGSFAILLLGFGSFYHGVPKNYTYLNNSKELLYNVEYKWWSDHIDNDYSIRISDIPKVRPNKKNKYIDLPLILNSKKNIPIGYERMGCTETMFVSFTAKRDIDVGEELLINIDEDIENKQRYIGDEEFSKYCL